MFLYVGMSCSLGDSMLLVLFFLKGYTRTGILQGGIYIHVSSREVSRVSPIYEHTVIHSIDRLYILIVNTPNISNNIRLQ